MHYERITRLLASCALLVAGFALAGPGAVGQVSGPVHDDFQRQVKDVLFDFDTHESPADIDALNTNAQWLKEHPQVRFSLEGYTDPNGDLVYNLALAQRRANTVENTLIEMGISPSRIRSSIGWGELYQTCHDQTEECWHRNRRVTFEYASE